MSITPPTLNSNPVVLDVDKTVSSKTQPLSWSSLLENEAQLTEEDRSMLLALSSASKGKGVTLLKNLGLDFDNMPLSAGYSDTRQQKLPVSPEKSGGTPRTSHLTEEPVCKDEIFEIIRNIQDPEHPLTLEQLGVVSKEQIEVYDAKTHGAEGDQHLSTVQVRFTPTIPHCSMATQIGLCLRVKLQRSLPPRFKTTVKIEPGTHASEKAVNKQLNDKERVCAALENKHLLGVVNRCIANGMLGQQ